MFFSCFWVQKTPQKYLKFWSNLPQKMVKKPRFQKVAIFAIFSSKSPLSEIGVFWPHFGLFFSRAAVQNCCKYHFLAIFGQKMAKIGLYYFLCINPLLGQIWAKSSFFAQIWTKFLIFQGFQGFLQFFLCLKGKVRKFLEKQGKTRKNIEIIFWP